MHNGTDAQSLTARVDGNGRVPEALAALASAGVGVAELTLGQPSLDDVFFALTGKTSDTAERGGDRMSMLATLRAPARREPWAATITLGWRAMLKIKHVPFQLFDVTAFPLMMTLMFTYLFGGALAGSVKQYVQYLIPGIVVQTIVFITVYTGVGLNSDISKGLFDRFRSVPIWQPSPIFGALLGDVFRYSLAATMVVTLGVIIGFRPQAGCSAWCSPWR